ncbi:hypothetical protein HYY75_04085 [bacterium]|nr:hypothetical protein [bacterium]
MKGGNHFLKYWGNSRRYKILLFWVVLLLSIVGFQSKKMIVYCEKLKSCAIITEFEVQKLGEESLIRVRVNTKIAPKIRYLPRESCWQIDFIEVEREKKIPEVWAFKGPLKLIQYFQIHNDPPIQRISCYVEPTSKMKFTRSGNEFFIRFKDSKFSGGSNSEFLASESRSRQPLLAPGFKR